MDPVEPVEPVGPAEPTGAPAWRAPAITVGVGLMLVLAGRISVTTDSGSFALFALGTLGGITMAVGAFWGALVPAARRPIGILLVGLAGAAIVSAFLGLSRYLWDSDDGEASLAIGAMLVLGLFLLATQPDGEAAVRAGRPGGGRRAAAYLALLVLAVPIALVAGMAHYTATYCSDPDFRGECDVAGLKGVIWAAAVIVLWPFAILVSEIVVRRRSRRRRRGFRPLSR